MAAGGRETGSVSKLIISGVSLPSCQSLVIYRVLCLTLGPGIKEFHLRGLGVKKLWVVSTAGLMGDKCLHSGLNLPTLAQL